ncbi:retropepsin-like aspartic protease [Sphingobacterium kitahiroshimense]|uniref:Retropepsin-like aspartic protease n=1 Tax=Sphingobacterium kitahiroshimense TaxID=470446 RepID=A0ABV0BNR6_9SPHI
MSTYKIQIRRQLTSKIEYLKIFIVAVILLLWSFKSFSQEAFTMNQGTIKEKIYDQSLPYEQLSGKMFVYITINGESYKFLFDTGAPLIVSNKIYTKLQLKKIQGVNVNDANGQKEESIITLLPQLNIGNITFLNSSAIVIRDDNDLFKCWGIEGIIGSNILRNSIVQIDQKSKTITIKNSIENSPLDKKSYLKMELSDVHSTPYINLNFDKNNVKVLDRVLFDTGANCFYDMSLETYNSLKGDSNLIKTLAQTDGVTSLGLHGKGQEQKVFALKIPKLFINDQVFSNVNTITSSGSESLLGTKILKYGKITLDYKQRRFFFEPYENIELKNIGKIREVGHIFHNNKFIIGVVYSKNLEKIVNVGDEILEIGNKNFANTSFCEALDDMTKDSDIPENNINYVLKDFKTGSIKHVKIKYLSSN